MPNWNLTEIICVLDKSGSMEPLAGEVITSFNHFIDEQSQAPGGARVTLVLFDTRYVTLYRSQSLLLVPRLSSRDYVAHGFTSLLDAVGNAIDLCGEEFAARPEPDQPGRVLVLIMTDGKENASREYTKAQIVERIARQRRQWHWEFVFTGANIDAFVEGHGLGVSHQNTANFRPTAEGVRHMFAGVSNATLCYRAGGTATLDNQQY